MQALLAMPFALDGSRGESVIEAHGSAHHIAFTIDPVRREPKIEHTRRRSVVQSGTRVTLHWPNSASSQLTDAQGRIVQIVDGFAWLNPHAALTLRVDAKTVSMERATDPAWRKWRPSDPAPAAWYDAERFSRHIAACVAHDQDHGRDRTVREFVGEFRGFARSDMQKRVLDDVGATRVSLREFFEKPRQVTKLLSCMQQATKPVAASDLGQLGREHFFSRFGRDLVLDTFKYRRAMCDINGVPYAVEAAFGYCPDNATHRQIVGVNWSPSLINPFRDLGPYGSLDALLEDQRAGKDDEPIILALHLASPCIAYTDKAKSALALPDAVTAELAEVVLSVTKTWAKIRKAEERDASRTARRQELLSRRHKQSIKDVAFAIMEQAYLKASNNGELPAAPTQIMYAARDEIQERTGRQLDRQYFIQTVLKDFLAENPKLTADWDIAYDDRGHFSEPHTGHTLGLGTLSVRSYLEELHDLKLQEPGLAPARIETCGPHGAFGALLYIEKEGFLPLFEQVQLARRFDIGIMSSKGMSVTAARDLADAICAAHKIPLLVLHDFDKSGFSILGTFQRRVSRRYTFTNKIKVIDLGLRLGDISGLQSEAVFDKGSEATRTANLRNNGATAAEIAFLLEARVELNAMTSRQLVAFVERKLQQHGIGKVVPKTADLAGAYRLFARSHEAEKIIRRELRKLNGSAKVMAPHDLPKQVHDYLRRHPATRWDAAVAAIVKAETKTPPRPDRAAS